MKPSFNIIHNLMKNLRLNILRANRKPFSGNRDEKRAKHNLGEALGEELALR